MDKWFLFYLLTLVTLPFISFFYYFLREIVDKEVVYINYEKSYMFRLLHDKCSNAELRTLLAALDVYGEDKTGYTPNMNRSLLMTEILKVQVQRFSQ